MRPFALALLAMSLAAADIEPAMTLAAGSAPMGADPLAQATTSSPDAGSMTVIPAPAGIPLPGTVLELRTAKPVAHTWDLQTSVRSTGAIAAGDMLVVECWMRTVASLDETGEARTAVIIEQRGDPWTKTISDEISIPADGSWLHVTCAGTAPAAYPAGGAQLNLHLGYARPQTIQVAGLRVVDLGRGVDFRSLPLRKRTYPGMAADAPWRAAAAERIERLRKGDLVVTVHDAAGKPVAGAPVHVAMLRHAFAFGSAIAPDRLIETGADGDRYRAWVERNCSRVVIENHLKWPMWEYGADPAAPAGRQRATTLAALQWLDDHHIGIKGHNLVWPSWHNSPKRLKALADDPAALGKAVDDHIADILSVTAPYHLVEWDVVNENYANHDITDILGAEAMPRWFREARAAFPQGGLLYNDYAHLVPARDTRFREFVEDTVLRLKAAGAPITGLGIQAHFGSSPSDPARMVAELDALSAKLGVQLAVTEFDFDTPDEDLQAAFTRDILTACFSHPAVEAFLTWGFWAGAHWRPAAAMLAKDWTERPNGKVWDELVHGAWWTDVTATTGPDGTCRIRGFKGLHRISSGSASVEAEIGDAPASATLALP